MLVFVKINCEHFLIVKEPSQN